MYMFRHPWLAAGALILALTAAGCGPADSLVPTPAAEIVPSAQPTTLASPTVAPSATAIPAASATVPAPTATPASPTAAPASPTTSAPATAEPAALLPADTIWIRSGAMVMAQGEGDHSISLGENAFPPFGSGALPAPDGSRLAYISREGHLVVVDLRSGATATLGGALEPMSFRFSPDSRELAAAFSDSQRWQLQVIELGTGAARTLQEGPLLSQNSGDRSLVLMPLAWTPGGIMVEQIMWATDAPPQGLALVDPADGTTHPVREEQHLIAAVNPDGTQVALVTGILPLGGEQPTMELRMLDVASRQDANLLRPQAGFVRQIRWSPDGTMLLFSMSENYGATTAAVVAIPREGTGTQRVDFEVQESVAEIGVSCP
jgi:dipeptidyl aminopeptidase/acylaminoacyl peptidase